MSKKGEKLLDSYEENIGFTIVVTNNTYQHIYLIINSWK